MQNDDTPAGLGLGEGLGPTFEAAAYECLSKLAGVDTHDVNLRDHDDAWAAIEDFASKVMGSESKRLPACSCPCCKQGIDAPHEYHLERRQMPGAALGA